MIEYALLFAFGCYGIALLFNLYRVVVAPGVPTGSWRWIRWPST